MPQIAAKEVRKQVMACTCPDAHKDQLQAALLSLPGLNLGKLAQIIQTISQLAVKYGPQIWADVQVLIALFSGVTPAPAPPPPAPGPIPAQFGSSNPRDLLRVHRSGLAIMPLLLVLCVVAVVLLLCGNVLASERLPVNQLGLPQNMLAECPCGPGCECGPNCQCGKNCDCGKEATEFAVLIDGDEQDSGDPLQQAPSRLPVNQTVAAPAVAALSFHYESRVRCTRYGCVPYTVVVMDGPPQAGSSGLVVQQPQAAVNYYAAPAASYQQYQSPFTAYQTVQGQTFASGDCASCTQSAGNGGGVAQARRGLLQRFREWRSAARSRRGGGGGCSSCGG